MYPADDLRGGSASHSEPVTTSLADRHESGRGSRPATGPTPLGLDVSHAGDGVCVVKVAGELDALTAPALTDCVRGQVSGGAKSMVIDLEAVDFLGSAGLGSL